jgi:uncharacterized protein YyaL (SSP411 family)
MNALQFEKSPYLLQHAANPVDWLPWGEEAFRKARELSRPIFLSIGYSTCHWCHVMAHECFADAEVAGLMNETFVSIKVDREERPDIDAHYMTACQLMTGSGGWPLTIVMTPEGTPFFAGTYIPKESAYGHVGMLDLVPRIRELWETRRDELLSSAATVAAALSEGAEAAAGEVPFGEGSAVAATQALSAHFDDANGGFGSAPKFPMASVYLLLLRAWRRGSLRAMEMAESALRAMRNGGVYDQIGFGFHRYSTDLAWRVPHFEKMLYDQALLCLAYVDAWRATGNDFYRGTALEICAYVLRDMTSAEGGFFSAEDADSEGEEGRFYLWTRAEIESTLSRGQREQFDSLYKGEAVQDHLILYRDPEETAPPGGVEEALRAQRQSRRRPSRDDKILTDWNGLMIAALARAGSAFGQPSLTRAASRAADFLLRRVVAPDGRLLHRYRDGEAAIGAFAEDFLFLSWGLLELYEATFQARWLQEAIRFTDEALALFWDQSGGGFFQTAGDAPGAPGARRKPLVDGAIPSANSVAVLVLTRVAEITGEEKYRRLAGETVRLYPASAESNALSFAFFLSAFDFFVGPTVQLVIAGDPNDPAVQAMLGAARARYLPNASVLLKPTNQPEPAIARIAPFTSAYGLLDGKPAGYVCRDRVCELPTSDPEVLLRNLGLP